MAVSLTLSSVNAYRNVQASSIDCSVPGSEGLFITKEKFEYADSELACISIGGSPIDLNNENFPIASKFIQSCTGPERLAWIGSWDYQPGSSDCQDCLSVSIGGSKPGEGIVDQNCKGPNHVLCQVGSSVVKHNPNYQLGQDIPRKINIAPHYGGYYGYAPNGYPGVTPAYYPGQYRNKFNPPHGPKGGFPGGVFPGGPGFGGGNGQTGWTKKNQNRQQSMAPTTVTVMAPAAAPVTVTEPAAAPVTVTAPAAAPVTVTEPAAAPVTVTAPAAAPVTVTEPAAAPVTVTAPAAAPVTVTVTEFAETILTNIELVTSYRTQTDVSTAIETKISTDTATEYLTQYSTLINTVTKDYTELLTTTEVSVREASTVTLQPDTVTLKPVTVTQGGETITIPASTITLPPGTVTLPPETVSLSPVTVTAPPVTTTKTAPVVTSVVYAIRDNTITTTVFSRLPAITSFKTEYQIKYTTSTIITTERVPGLFGPCNLPSNFLGGPHWCLGGGLLGGQLPPGGTSFHIDGSKNYLCCNGPEFHIYGPGLLGPCNLPSDYLGGLLWTTSSSLNYDGSYTFLQGGPPSSGSAGGSISLPFNVPGFSGPGIYTLSPGNVVSIKNDGSYTFLQGGPPSAGGSSTNNVMSIGTLSVPNKPGIYTLSNGDVVSVSTGGTYSFIRNGSSSSSSSSGSSPVSIPFNVPGFKGPGVYTLSPGNVVSFKSDGSYTFLQGGPPPTGLSGSAPAQPTNANFNGVNIPNYSGSGIYTLLFGNIISIAKDGRFSYISGQGLLGEKTGSFGLPSLSLPSFNFATPSPLPIFQLNQIIDEAEEPEVVKVEPEAVRPSESAEKSGFNFGAVSFPAFARRAIATFV
ncbi:hypothetical protein K501DRAFT_272005 [Backusella circina FSU 941]|nr:hypothetical protein K501DRAFT_272005 [Backusella circina FSU 941]